MSETAAAASSRPRLNLKPRNEDAAKQLELQRTASGKNPFGDAKPREAVLASRTGKSETEILVEEVKAEKPKLRLNPSQLEEKRAAEAAVSEVRELLASAEDDAARAPLKDELAARQAALDELMAGFEKLALEAAARGDFVRPSERRRQLLESQGSGGEFGLGADPSGYGGGRDGGYGGRGYGGPRGGGGGGGYRDAPGGYREPGRSGGYGGGRGGYGGGGGGGGYYDREGGGRGGYEARDYRGPSDYDNVETFGAGAAGYGRDRARGGRSGGTGRPDGRGYGFGGGGGGGFGGGGDDYYGGGGGGDVQDRY